MKTKWKCKDGTVIKVSNMTTNHLRNVIKFLEQKFADDPYCSPCCGFATAEGDIDFDEPESYESVEEKYPVYKSMKRELDKRAKPKFDPELL